MLRNYLIIAIRNLLKQKTFTLINVFGLSVGVASCMIFGLYVHHELSYDRHHPNAEQIYRVIQEITHEAGNKSFSPFSVGGLRPFFQNDMPGVQASVRVLIRKSSIVNDNFNGIDLLFCLADPEILRVFNLPLVQGDPQTALSTPNGLLITESAAKTYFGPADPIGKMMHDKGKFPGEYIVTGVLKDLPETSLLQFDFLTSTVPGLTKTGSAWRENGWLRKSWENKGAGGAVQNYLVLKTATQSKDIEEQLSSLVLRFWGEDLGRRLQYHLQPLVKAHLYSKQNYGLSGSIFGHTNGDIRHLYVATILGGFILLLAGINFVNLSTARSAIRAKEVGMRKVVGANRHQIIGQFLGESILLSAFAHLFALLIVDLSLPYVSSWLSITLSIAQIGFWSLLCVPLSVLIIGCLAGSCPAFLISAFKPITALKGGLLKEVGGTSLRRGLVLFQFSISVLLIAGTYVVFSQWQFMIQKDPGYKKENVIIVPFRGGNPAMVRQRFLKHPNILYACATNGTPVGATGFRAVRPEGETEPWRMHHLDLTEGVLDVFGIELLQGRDFSADISSDRNEAYLLNEAAVKALGWKDPIGKSFRTDNWPTGRVIGVVKDFHFKSLHQEIKPLFLKTQGAIVSLSLRVSPENLAETMNFIRTTWKDLSSNRPGDEFRYEFLDQRLEAVYRADQKASQMFSVAAMLAILIACLGLIGLASFSTEQRTKEIGIRKVLGATWPNLVALFTRDFIKLVALANILMIPVSFYLTQTWLNQFAYRIEPGPYPVILSAILSLLIATLTVSFIVFRATTKNPVDALRNE